MQFLAFVERDDTGGYRATLPDFPGCVAVARSWSLLEASIRSGVDDFCAARAAPFPSPTPIELLHEQSASRDSCWMFVALTPPGVQPAIGRRSKQPLQSRA